MEKVAVKERPILFSGPMVRAILEGRKTQTRRVMKPQPEDDGRGMLLTPGGGYCAPHVFTAFIKCPYGQAGDRLWVRETFSYQHGTKKEPCWYWADGNPQIGDYSRPKPSIHMPRWASRITLEVTDVRVERLQEISEEDALAEGTAGAAPEDTYDSARDEYASLWNKLNAKRGFGWDVNPFVWVVEFRRVS